MRNETVTRAAVFALAFGAAAFLFPPAAEAEIAGRWMLDFDRGEDRVQLTTKRVSSGHGGGNHSSSYPTSSFRGSSARPRRRPPPLASRSRATPEP